MSGRYRQGGRSSGVAVKRGSTVVCYLPGEILREVKVHT